MNAIKTLQTAVRIRDYVLGGRAVDSLRNAGHNYQQCFRIALAGNPSLTLDAWEDFMMEIDALDGE